MIHLKVLNFIFAAPQKICSAETLMLTVPRIFLILRTPAAKEECPQKKIKKEREYTYLLPVYNKNNSHFGSNLYDVGHQCNLVIVCHQWTRHIFACQSDCI